MTTDVAEAREWLESWTDVPGLEGVVVKGMSQPYRPSVRGWTKVRRRDTTEGIIGSVTGSLARPQLLVLGRRDQAGRLHAIGRTIPLRPDASRSVGEHLVLADPGMRGRGCGSPRRGGPVTSWTSPWSAPSWGRSSAPTPAWTWAASSGTRCDSGGCAWM
ncbi:hypothetical protein [Streptomyces sp. CB00455]|uniref:hypothetical protein n=1 Tax=Streptomyces sp. CB00455 TaxID=1703927 RepID=UPI0018FE5A95|nr:hypothetical protein [Streptomyces sp. CB00455]